MTIEQIDAETQLKNLDSAIDAYLTSQINLALASYMKVQNSNFDASSEPYYPSANRGEATYITTGGKIGGSSGKVVEAGDVAIAIQTNAGGSEASVGTDWFILQKNIQFDNISSHWLNGQGSFTTPTAAQMDTIPTDGWIAIAHTWTRTGNHTYTISGSDLTAYYRKGTKVRYKDGGAYEYGVIGSSSFASSTTTVNLIPNTDYAMAATTITDTYLSYIENPQGFPATFNYAATLTSAGGTITSYTMTFATWAVVLGKICVNFKFTITNNGSGATYLKLTWPIAATVYGSGISAEIAVVGTLGSCVANTAVACITMTTYNNGYPGGTNYQIIGTLFYDF